MTPLPGELAHLFFPPDTFLPELYLCHPDENVDGTPAPETVLARLGRYAPFFPGEVEVDPAKTLLAVRPEQRLLLPVPRWLSALLAPEKQSALPTAFYRLVFSLLPPPEFFLGQQSGLHPSTLFGQLLSRGALTPDMLLGLLSLPGLGGYARELSPRVRRDLEVMRSSRGDPAPGWMILSALLFRLNAAELHTETPAGSWQLLRRTAHALLTAKHMPGANPALLLAAMEEGTAVLRTCSEALLVNAFAPFPGETAQLFSEILSARKWRHLVRYPLAQPADRLESGCTRFELLRRVQHRQAVRRPFFDRDLVAFLKRERTAVSRRFLLLEAGINRLASGLAAMTDAVRVAFLEPCDGELALLLCEIFSGRIVLQEPASGRAALEQLATDWRMLELAGVWGAWS